MVKREARTPPIIGPKAAPAAEILAEIPKVLPTSFRGVFKLIMAFTVGITPPIARPKATRYQRSWPIFLAND